MIRSFTKIWLKRVPSKGDSRCKGLGMELSVACLRNMTEVGVARKEGSREEGW